MTVRVFGLGLLPASARRRRLFEAACRKALRRERRDGPGELNLVVLARSAMRRMNREYLRHDYDTDVIAFPYPRSRRPAADAPFGDVFVSAHMVRVQARELGHSALEEALTLAVHGTLHLLGHRDKAAKAKAAMFKRQDEIVRETLAGA